jgi:phage FluMu protein Com
VGVDNHNAESSGSLDLDQVPVGQLRNSAPAMAHILYQCPRTAMKVQTWLAEEAPAAARPQAFEAVTCPACTQLHFINRTTGKLLGDGSR